jgi:hypothetical protein
MREGSLEAVLVGNAAAASQGAPVTTVDFDFFFPKTPRTMTKVRALARALHATVASLADIIQSKWAAGRPGDKAVIDILEKAHAETASAARRAQGPEVRAWAGTTRPDPAVAGAAARAADLLPAEAGRLSRLHGLTAPCAASFL